MGMNMQKLMKQAQKMQAEMAILQEKLKDMTADGASGGGLVKATANGKQEIVGIKIDKTAVDPEDVEMLEDLILAAIKDAQRQSAEMAEQAMQQVTGGMNLPGMF